MFRRYFRYFTVILITSLIFTLVRHKLSSDNSSTKFQKQQSGCVIPEVRIFDVALNFIFRRRDEWKCQENPPSFIRLSPENVLSIDWKIFAKFYPDQKLSRCEYVPIRRGNSRVSEIPDDGIMYDVKSKIVFLNETEVADEFIKITCRNGSGSVILSEFKALVVKKDRRPVKTDEKLNVLIIGVDSVSKMNFKRHFEKSSKILKNLGAFSLQGYNKVQLNTLVNIIPLLAGQNAQNVIDFSVPSYLDNVPFIWKRFSRSGYLTLFAEDGPTMGMFNYGNKGFYKRPTDYYFRPFSVAVDLSNKTSKDRIKCIGSKLEIDLVFEWVGEFCRRYSDDRFFALGYTSTLTHDDLNDAGYADYPLARLLETLSNDSVFMNRTAIFVISDHGLQFADDLIMDPYSWQLEERLPFAHVLMPKWYLDIRNASTNLSVNQRRLTSPFDIHKTLLDILADGAVEDHNEFGVSLFDEIPKERTCAQAGIPLHYCACHTYKLMDVDGIHPQESAQSVLQYINDMTMAKRNKCALLHLDKIENFEQRISDSDTMSFFRITVRTRPNDGIFESTVRYRVGEGTYDVIDGGVNRVNRYANQSTCIRQRNLFPFCFCSAV